MGSISGANPRRLIAELQTVPELVNYYSKTDINNLLSDVVNGTDYATADSAGVVKLKVVGSVLTIKTDGTDA